MCWRCPSSFPRMHSGSACQRVTAAASPRSVPTERRKRARKSGRDHPSSRQHAECKFELHGPALRHMLEVPLFVSEDALRLSMSARDGRSIAKVRADRTSKTSAQKWQRSSFLASTRGVQTSYSNCTDRRCVMCWRCPSSFPRMHSGSAVPARDGRSIAKVRADRTSKTSAQKWQRSSFLASTRGVQVRTARTGAASCVGGAPLRFRGCTPAQQCQRVTAAASPRSVPTERRKRARKSGRDHPSSRQHAECKFELHGPALRHVLEVPLFVSEDALRRSK